MAIVVVNPAGNTPAGFESAGRLRREKFSPTAGGLRPWGVPGAARDDRHQPGGQGEDRQRCRAGAGPGGEFGQVEAASHNT
jgi:hypothetical protein